MGPGQSIGSLTTNGHPELPGKEKTADGASGISVVLGVSKALAAASALSRRRGIAVSSSPKVLRLRFGVRCCCTAFQSTRKDQHVSVR